MRELAASHARAKLRFWRVIESWPGERLLVEPYASGRQITVESPSISRDVARWDIVLGRLKPDSAEFWGVVRSYRASDEEDLRHLLARLAHRLGLDQDALDEIAGHAPAQLFSFEPRPLVPVTTEGDPIAVVSARWRVRRDVAAAALRRCEQCLDDGGGSFTWIAERQRLVAMQPDPMPRGAAVVETSVVDSLKTMACTGPGTMVGIPVNVATVDARIVAGRPGGSAIQVPRSALGDRASERDRAMGADRPPSPRARTRYRARM